jgi:hypothetical protein
LHADRVEPLGFAVQDAIGLAGVPDLAAFPPDLVLLVTDAAAGRDEVVRHLSVWLPQQAGERIGS